MKKQRINQEISTNSVVLIDKEGKSLGQLSYDQAMLLAYDKEVDLVEVGPNANPPVCKLLDHDKEIYREQKKIQKHKARQKAPELKEIKLSMRIGQHDFDTKINRAKEFFAEGDKVRVFIKLMGREMKFMNKTEEIIEKFRLSSGSEYEQPIKRLGNMFSAILKKKKI